MFCRARRVRAAQCQFNHRTTGGAAGPACGAAVHVRPGGGPALLGQILSWSIGVLPLHPRRVSQYKSVSIPWHSCGCKYL